MANNNYWMKLWFEILRDPKMGMLPDRLWRRIIELFLLAGEYGQEGILPDEAQIAWLLNRSVTTIRNDLKAIAKTGIVTKLDDGAWKVTNFQKRNAPVSTAKRVKDYRHRQRYENNQQDSNNTDNGNDNASDNDDVTERYQEEQKNRRTEEQKNRRTELTPPTPPGVEKEAAADFGVFNPVAAFSEVTGMPAIPASEAEAVITALDAIWGDKGGTAESVAEYLKPYYEAWTSRRRKDGKYYSRTNCKWLTDWAVSGEIPPPPPEPEKPPMRKLRDPYGNVIEVPA